MLYSRDPASFAENSHGCLCDHHHCHWSSIPSTEEAYLLQTRTSRMILFKLLPTRTKACWLAPPSLGPESAQPISQSSSSTLELNTVGTGIGVFGVDERVISWQPAGLGWRRGTDTFTIRARRPFESKADEQRIFQIMCDHADTSS